MGENDLCKPFIFPQVANKITPFRSMGSDQKIVQLAVTDFCKYWHLRLGQRGSDGL